MDFHATQRTIDDAVKLIKADDPSSKNRSFTRDNRIGIPSTLHRISAIRDKFNDIVGLTYRVGRHIDGVAELIADIVRSLGTHSILLLGPPGTGKTSLLRDITRILADEKQVVVVDTSNEIAGDGSSAHECIGKARRMQVQDRSRQDEVLIEAVQNHTPQVIVIDEIATSKEVEAASSISQRGVSMVATAHGNNLHSLMSNPPLVRLIGGIESVTLGDAEARARSKNFASGKPEPKKTVLERRGSPIFQVVIELLGYRKWRIHKRVDQVVDALLRGEDPIAEVRWQEEDGSMFSEFCRMRSVSFDEKWFESDEAQ